MKFFAKHCRLLTVFLTVAYCLSPNGLGSLLSSGLEYMDSQWSFACKGFGCQCDIAGRELPNCRCDHTSPDEESCCSEVVITCSDKTCEPASDNVFSQDILKKPGCGGLLIDNDLTALKHPPIDRNTLQITENFKLSLSSEIYPINYDFTFILPIHKVPIS